MGIGRYFDFAKEVIEWIAAWVDLVLTYLKEIVAVLIIMWIALKLIDFILAWTSRRKVIATVNHIERVYYPHKLRSMYLIYTDKGVFRNQDSWPYLAFNSSDVYSKLKVGSTYKLIVYGYRNRWGSEYPNVLKIKKAPE